MKKIILMFVVMLMAGGSVASAKITHGVDEFEGAAIINSIQNPKDSGLVSLMFQKISGSKEQIFKIEVQANTFPKLTLAKEPVMIKIDDNLKHTLQVNGYKNITAVFGRDVFTRLDVEVPLAVINELKVANRVALKFTQNNGSTFVYVLTDDVLNEWKEVIATEE